MATQSTMVPAGAGDESKWNFLDDTTWIVPTIYLPAVVLANLGTPHLVPVVDQTVWHIEAVVAGYVFGEVEPTSAAAGSTRRWSARSRPPAT